MTKLLIGLMLLTSCYVSESAIKGMPDPKWEEVKGPLEYTRCFRGKMFPDGPSGDQYANHTIVCFSVGNFGKPI